MKELTSIDFPIDIVIPWVDQSDPVWFEKFRRFSPDNHDSDSDTRFRDYGTLKYVFRSIEKFAPWVNRVFLITDNQTPTWINKSYEKLFLINHSDYIENKYLPTFDSNVIELNLANIKELSEHFICFNDDTFLNKPVLQTDFFDVKGNPKDSLAFNAIMPMSIFDHIHINNMMIINHKFSKKRVMKQNLLKFFNFKNGPWNIFSLLLLPWPKFTRFYDPHIPISFVKKTYQRTLKEFPEILEMTGADPFRSEKDYSNWVIRYIQMLNGEFTPRSYKFGVHYSLEKWKDAITDIENSTHYMININDSNLLDDKAFEEVTQKLEKTFKKKFFEVSQFELSQKLNDGDE